MPTQRKFAGFSRGAPTFRMSETPEGGFCLSSFVLLMDGGGRVLMGKLNPDYDWEHIGALDEERKIRHSSGWMLPSSHLMVGEAPEAAARRILREQLGIESLELTGPTVISETYRTSPARSADHWDIEFVFSGRYDKTVKHPAWKELAYVDPNADDGQFARNHQDILRSSRLRR